MKLRSFTAKQQKFHRAKARAIAAGFGHPRPTDAEVDKALEILGEGAYAIDPRHRNYMMVDNQVGLIRDYYRGIVGLPLLVPTVWD